MIMRRGIVDEVEDERRSIVRVTVRLDEVWGAVFLGMISLLLVVILGIVVVRLSGRRSA